MSSVAVKVTFQPKGDDFPTTRLLLLPTDPAPSWDALTAQIQHRFSLKATPTALFYTDIQGDEITVSSSEDLAGLWTVTPKNDALILRLGSRQTQSHADTANLLNFVRKAVEEDPSFARNLHRLVKSASRPRGHPRSHTGGTPSQYGHHRREHHGHGKEHRKGRFGGRRGKHGDFARFHRDRLPPRNFGDSDESSESGTETFEQHSDSEEPSGREYSRFPHPHGPRHSHGRPRRAYFPHLESLSGAANPLTHPDRMHHAFGPPPPFPPPPPFAFSGFPHSQHIHPHFP